MKSDVETLDATTVKLTVEVTGEELKPSVDHAYQAIASQVQVPGFRKGKVPARIIDQRIGRAAVVEQAVNEGMATFYRQAITEANLRPLGQPEIEVTEIPALTEATGGLTFTAQVEVRPEIALPALDSLTVTVDDVEVTEADVDARLDSLRERFGTLVGVDRPAADGDFVVLDLAAHVGEEEVDAVSGISYQIGAGNMLEGLDEALVGLSAGETTTFETALAGGEHAGETATVTVTATSVKVRDLPEPDDDFAQLASEFDTLEELRADLRVQVAGTKASNQAVQARDALLTALREQVEIPIPSGVVQAEVHRHLESEGRLEDDEHRAEVEKDATENLTQQILLDVLAEQLEIKVSQQELVDYLINAAQQYGMDPNEFIQTLDQQGQIPAMIGEVGRSKSVAVALRQVSVVDSTGSAVDLTPYIGTDEEAQGEEPEAGEASQADEQDEAEATPAS
ncbi:trigger factor [Isoptericola sp. b441]|uniref:Trigger factor n=1 Tax=Actinotalea lenta TaxID=3064654 RepID=A0ABT9DAH2_9CELL|nr:MULTISPECIES: trigger factor [unclassified Isoptericola]MDO8107274.1 trigger factor [Isoptericola sp. b441]MDO8121064.1 trigger factor [Isoptericola sp. b490]